MIVKCTCKNAYQDQTYGVGNRVANQMKAQNSARCTSCEKIIGIGSAKADDKPKADEKTESKTGKK